ncbi:MAG: methyl-accepting chemotaxis protein [Myxococcota bacterium]|nr:methyl-accepting chemotaxis protein [Myxococcota bacterium]
MRWLGNASLRHKLLFAIVGTTAAALLVVTVTLVVLQSMRATESLVDKTETLAAFVGLHSQAALLFQDGHAAEETLSALRAEPLVLAAAIYLEDGSLFASFGRDGEPELPESPEAGTHFRPGILEVAQPIEDGGEAMGRVFVRVDTLPLFSQAMRNVGVAAAVALVALAVAGFLARNLQRSISQPVEMLVGHSHRLTEGDLTAEVGLHREDEIGQLARAFAAMGASLRVLVSEIHESGNGVSEAAVELGATSQGVVEESRRQLQTVSATGDSIRNVSASVQQVASSVGVLASQAKGTSGSMEQMDRSIELVASCADELSTAMQSIAEGVGELDERAAQVAEGMSHLDSCASTSQASVMQQAQAIRLVRDGAQSSLDLSRQNAEEAERGMSSVQDTIQAIQEIERSFRKVAEVVDALVERSDSIGKILSVIEDVAGETQLLSLNAAIIAAQAGERGQAFAVVANQVKELAGRTGNSTREIAQLISHVQSETAQAVGAVSEGKTRVEEGVARSREAGDRLRAIIEAANSSREQVEQIVDATESQSRDLHQVESAVGEVRTLVEQTHVTLEDQKRASGEIRGTVARVRELDQRVRAVTSEQRQDSREVTTAIEQLAAGLEQIRVATREQQKASESMEADRVVFQEIAEENARRAESLGSIVEAMEERARVLTRAVGRFRV